MSLSPIQLLLSKLAGIQRRYDMRHEMLTQRALFCHRANTK